MTANGLYDKPLRQSQSVLCQHWVHRAVVSREKVANVLLAKGSGLNIAHAARGIARSVARELLSPLMDAACARLGFVLRRAYDVACERQQLLEGALKLQGALFCTLRYVWIHY